MSKVIIRAASAYKDMLIAVVEEVANRSSSDRSASSILAEAEAMFNASFEMSSRHAKAVPTHGIEVAELDVEEIILQ